MIQVYRCVIVSDGRTRLTLSHSCRVTEAAPAPIVKPKFHYADFPVTSATSPRQTRDVPSSQDSITPLWGSRRNGIWAKGDVTGLSRSSR